MSSRCPRGAWARHLDVLANALFPSGEPEVPWGSAYEPVVLEVLVVRHLDRARVVRLKTTENGCRRRHLPPLRRGKPRVARRRQILPTLAPTYWRTGK
jgi:hypothetical protein